MQFPFFAHHPDQEVVLLIAESGNHRGRKVTTAGTIVPVAEHYLLAPEEVSMTQNKYRDSV